MLKRILSFILCASLLLAQGPTKLTDGTGKEAIYAANGLKTNFYMQAITTGGVTITSVDTYVQLIYCANTTGSVVTITLADTQGSPVTFGSAVPLPANSITLVFASAIGLFMHGLKLTASSNSAISCQVQGVQ